MGYVIDESTDRAARVAPFRSRSRPIARFFLFVGLLVACFFLFFSWSSCSTVLVPNASLVAPGPQACRRLGRCIRVRGALDQGDCRVPVPEAPLWRLDRFEACMPPHTRLPLGVRWTDETAEEGGWPARRRAGHYSAPSIGAAPASIGAAPFLIERATEMLFRPSVTALFSPTASSS